MNTNCVHCFRFLHRRTPAWLHHEPHCNRMLEGQCRCHRWSCSDCSPNTTVITPRAALIRVAHEQQMEMVRLEDEQLRAEQEAA